MAKKSVAIESELDPQMYGAKSVHGNYTEEAEMHLWCASALSCLVATPEVSLKQFNDDIQAAIRYLLKSEIHRAQKAAEA